MGAKNDTLHMLQCTENSQLSDAMGQERRFRPDRAMSALTPIATAKADMVEPGGRNNRATPLARCAQISTCSDMARASSISMPRYRTVLSIFVCPSKS
jgi:hypothetical protein